MFTLEPIGYIHSCFKEKFAIPRQSLLAPLATGVLELLPPFNQQQALEGLEQVSHIWLLFIFHQTLAQKHRLKVRPPRLGGNKSLGVFATRSTFRPNGLGQSVVKLDNILDGKLYLSGIDLLDGTPIVDIKPYVPYADTVTDAFNHIAPAPPPIKTVNWTEQALKQANEHATRLDQPLIGLINQCLSQDPRPAYHTPAPEKRYGTRLWDLEIQWHYPTPNNICVLMIHYHCND